MKALSRNGTVKNVNSGKISFLSKPGHFPRPHQVWFLRISFKMLCCCPKNTQVIVERVAKILSKCGQNSETGSSNASHWTTRLTRQRLWPLAVHVFLTEEPCCERTLGAGGGGVLSFRLSPELQGFFSLFLARKFACLESNAPYWWILLVYWWLTKIPPKPITSHTKITFRKHIFLNICQVFFGSRNAVKWTTFYQQRWKFQNVW